MKGRNDFSDRVLTRVITSATEAVPGVATITSSWVEIGTRSYPRCEFRVDIDARSISVDSFLAVSWPSPVTEVASQVQRNIAAWLQAMTGLTATRVNVVVEQTVSGHGRVTPADVAAAAHAPTLRTFSVRASSPVRSPVTTRTTEPVSPVTAPPAALRGISTRPSLDPVPPVVSAADPLRAVGAPPAKEVTSPEIPSPRTLRPVAAPPPTRVVSPRTAPPPLLRTPRAPAPGKLAEITWPASHKARPVSAPPAPRLAPLEPGRQRPLKPVRIPEKRLRPITVAPQPVLHFPAAALRPDEGRRRVD